MTDTAQEREQTQSLSEGEQEFVRAAMAKLAQDLIGALWELPGFQHTKGNSVVEDVLDLARRLRARQREEGDGGWIRDFVNRQEYLSPDDAELLQDNLWSLYQTTDATPQREGEREPVRFVGVTTQSFPDGEWLQGLTADGRLYQWNGAEWQELTDGPLYTEPPAERDRA